VVDPLVLEVASPVVVPLVFVPLVLPLVFVPLDPFVGGGTGADAGLNVNVIS
jgi:hypothetical protein